MIYYKIKVDKRYYNDQDKCLYPNIQKGTRYHDVSSVKEVATSIRVKYFGVRVVRVTEEEIDIDLL